MTLCYGPGVGEHAVIYINSLFISTICLPCSSHLLFIVLPICDSKKRALLCFRFKAIISRLFHPLACPASTASNFRLLRNLNKRSKHKKCFSNWYCLTFVPGKASPTSGLKKYFASNTKWLKWLTCTTMLTLRKVLISKLTFAKNSEVGVLKGRIESFTK